MKKLLSILGATSIVVSSGINVTACDTGSKTVEDNVIREGNIGIGDDSICKIVNVAAERHWTKQEMVDAGSAIVKPKVLGSENVTEKDIIAGINYMNGIGLTEEDVTVTYNAKMQTAKVVAKPNSKFTGENNFYINKGVKFEKFIKVKDLGDVYMPESLKFPPATGFLLGPVAQLTMLAEYIGDRNREFEQIVDVMALLSAKSATSDKLVKIQTSTASITLPPNELMEGTIEIKFNVKKDDRPEIKDLIKNTDLGKISGDSDEEIIKAVYDKNKDKLKKYGLDEMLDALEVFHEKDRDIIQFKAGNNNFKGHDTAAFTILNIHLSEADRLKKEDYQLEINYSI